MDPRSTIQSNARDAIAELEGMLGADAGYQDIWRHVRGAGVRIERIKEILTEDVGVTSSE